MDGLNIKFSSTEGRKIEIVAEKSKKELLKLKFQVT